MKEFTPAGRESEEDNALFGVSISNKDPSDDVSGCVFIYAR